MKPDIENRVEREVEFYDKKQLRRDALEEILAYLNEGIGRQQRNEAIRSAMRDATGVRVLEIGSQSWEWCLARYGYRPAQLTCINISQAELEIGRLQAQKLGVCCDFRKVDRTTFNSLTVVSTWSLESPSHITLSLAVRCARSIGYFATAAKLSF
jgi:hypothetical protein